MTQVSRPLLAVLVAAIAFLGLWMVALKPGAPSSSAAPATTTFASGVLSAPAKARAAVAAANAASSAHGGSIASAPSTLKNPSKPGTSAGGTASSTRGAVPARAPAPSPATATQHSPTARRLDVVSRALVANKVLALLFFNPASSDDREVKQELAAVPLHGGRVVELAVPTTELARYPVVTSQVPVDGSPTLVVIDPDHKATTIVGFADSFEISQRIADALSVV